MPKEVRLPQLGQTMEEGTIVTALVKVGDTVKKGDVLFEIETDKATLEMESPAEGFVRKILIEVGQTVPVGTPVLILGRQDEEISQSYIDSLTGSETSTVSPSPVKKSSSSSAAIPASSSPAQQPASPPAPGAAALPEGTRVICLPQLGQTMEEGTIVTVLIQVGDEVKKGDVLFEIETDKATLEMESPAAGFVKAVLAEVGQTLPINTPILILADKEVEIAQACIDSIKSGGPATATPSPQAPVPTTAQPPTAAATTPIATGGRVFASPRAKMVAAQLGLDLARISASSGAVRITEADVRKAAQGGIAPAATMATVSAKYGLGQRIAINRLQRIVGEKMLLSKQTIPCFYLNIQVDMTELVKLRTRMNKSGDVKISFNDFIIKAVAMGLRHYPIMTGRLDGDHIQMAETIDIGLAISTDLGLVAPIVKNTGAKSLREIAVYCQGLIDRARTEKLSLDDLTGGCITVSNLGGFGIDSFIPIVVPGQTSILGVGRINDVCLPMDGNIMVRKVMNLNLSVDHKVANGADAAQFLDFVKKALEHTDNFTQ
ncbi:MAG: 2-oxo acid dehydrogenase subunit E2 [Sedimentisphaerales bacterium]|nr:2-oxo acid dehydrogenase subunit E2 [Sedimentisphaerales bacterium]